MDCGKDGNKVCMGDYYTDVYGMDWPTNIDENVKPNQCIAIPIIDDTEVTLNESLIYMCS